MELPHTPTFGNPLVNTFGQLPHSNVHQMKYQCTLNIVKERSWCFMYFMQARIEMFKLMIQSALCINASYLTV